jgi:hypothetical protein
MLLGGWLGAWLLFALVVAPTAFHVLPSVEAAGELVGPVLRALHLYGVGAGLAVAALGAALRRGRLAAGLAVSLALVCGFSQFVVSGAIVQVLPSALGPGSLPDAAARFSHLHRLSVALYSLVGVGVATLVVLHSRADARDTRKRST